MKICFYINLICLSILITGCQSIRNKSNMELEAMNNSNNPSMIINEQENGNRHIYPIEKDSDKGIEIFSNTDGEMKAIFWDHGVAIHENNYSLQNEKKKKVDILIENNGLVRIRSWKNGKKDQIEIIMKPNGTVNLISWKEGIKHGKSITQSGHRHDCNVWIGNFSVMAVLNMTLWHRCETV